MDGTSCGTPSLFDSFDEFDYSNVVLYIYGNKRSDETSDTNSKLSQYVNTITNQIPSNFLNEFNQAFAGAGILSSFKGVSLTSGQTYNPPILDSTSVVTVRARDTYITVSSLKLTSGVGIFYGIADIDNGGLPTLAQVRGMENAENVQVSGDAAYFTKDSVSLTFTGLLSDTDYMVHFYGTNEDRTQYAATTPMSSVKTRTLPLGESLIFANLGLIFIGFITMIFV